MRHEELGLKPGSDLQSCTLSALVACSFSCQTFPEHLSNRLCTYLRVFELSSLSAWDALPPDSCMVLTLFVV